MERIELELDVDSAGGVKGTQSLKARIKEAQVEAQKMAESFGATSKQAVEAAKKAAGLKEELADIKQTIDALHPEAKFNAIIGVAQGIAGGFSAAQGAMALFGGESENVQKALLKVQAAMAISQGLNEINGLKDSFQNLGIVLRNSTVYTKAASLAQVAYTTIVGTSTGALKLFRLALVATGLGAFVVAIGYVIANWDDMKERIDKNSEAVKKWGLIFGAVLFPAVAMIVGQYLLLKKGLDFVGERFDFVNKITGKVSDQFGILTGKIKELLITVGLLDSVEEERAEKNLVASKKREEQIQRQIELAKAEGKSAQEVAALEVSLARERFLAYNQMIEAKRKAGRDITEEETKQLTDLAFELKKSKLAEQKTIDDAAKKAQDQAKKDYDEKKRKAEDYRKYLADIQKQIEDAEINALKDEHQKAIALINKNYDEKLNAIKGNSARELRLRALLENEQAVAIQAINDKFAQQSAQDAANEIQKTFENKIALLEAQKIELELANKNTFDTELALTTLRKNQEILLEGKTAEQKKLIIAKYEQDVAALEKKAADDKKKSDQDIANAKIAIATNTLSSLNSIGTLFIKDQKKLQKFQNEVAVAQLAIDTAKSISSTIAGATAAAAAGGPAAPFLLAGYITSGIATVLGAFAQAKKLLSSDSGTGNTPSLSSSSSGAAQGVQPPQFNSTASPVTVINRPGENQNINVTANVVETDVTQKQKRVKDIQNRATFP
jgi:hypothetical protein